MCLLWLVYLSCYVIFRLISTLWYFRIKHIMKVNRRAHAQITANVPVSRSTKQNTCLPAEERLLLHGRLCKRGWGWILLDEPGTTPFWTRIYGGGTTCFLSWAGKKRGWGSQTYEERVRTGADWWWRCGACQPMLIENKRVCCTELDLVPPWWRGQHTKRLYHNELHFANLLINLAVV